MSSSCSSSNISFKVFLEHLSLVRKISVENTGLDYEVLRQKVQSLLPEDEPIARGDFLLQYIDEDGDRITVGGDEELKQMLIDMEFPYRLQVRLLPGLSSSKAPSKTLPPPATAAAADHANAQGLEHPGSLCICCHQIIMGFRYKCLVCPNYDICGRCESRANHPAHDMMRISGPKQYPPHFFTRLHRLFDRLHTPSSSPMIRSPHSSTTGPPGLEPMAKDLIDDETDLSDGPFEDIIFDTPMEVVPATAATTIVTAPCPASTTGDDNGRGDLPSIEELTRHMQDLADKDVEEEVVAETRRREEVAVSRPTSRLSSVSARCPASDAARSQSPGCTEGVAVIEESSEVALPQVLEPEKEKEAEKIRKIEDRERKEALEQEILEHKIVKEVFEEKREELESIQNLQEEINKLLAPLNSSNNNSSTNVVADTPVIVPEVEKRRKEESPLLTKDSSRSSPFEICDNPKVIIEKAIIEDNQGKRERRISTDQEESSPSKCPRKSSNEVTEAIEFDAITVEEVTEELNDSVNCGNAEEGEEDEYEYEEYEEEEEEAAAVTAKQESIDRDEIALEKAKAREEDRKRQEELKKKNDQYSNDNMELRRALHRAGLDSSFIDSPITTNPTLFKYASSYSQKKTPEPSPAPEPAVIAKRSTTTSLVPEDNLSYSRYFSGSRYAAGKVGPSSRVSEARDQMLAMGFTDEDGWLTELITMKRGNIDQVLEVLMPVGKP